MKNKHVGWLLIGIAVFVGVMLFFFSNSSKTVLNNSCPIIAEGHACPAYAALDNQMYFALAVVGILVLVGIFLFFSKPEEKTVEKTIIKEVEKKEKLQKINITTLKPEEKKIVTLLLEKKAMFQADLVDTSGMNKVKVSRILDKLEGYGIIERKRRGMHNIVILKQ